MEDPFIPMTSAGAGTTLTQRQVDDAFEEAELFQGEPSYNSFLNQAMRLQKQFDSQQAELADTRALLKSRQGSRLGESLLRRLIKEEIRSIVEKVHSPEAAQDVDKEVASRQASIRNDVETIIRTANEQVGKDKVENMEFLKQAMARLTQKTKESRDDKVVQAFNKTLEHFPPLLGRRKSTGKIDVNPKALDLLGQLRDSLTKLK